MAINDEPPSSPSSPFSWRVIRDPKDNRTSSKSSSSKSKSTTKPKKSHGISPSQFHAKKLSPRNNNNNTGDDNDNDNDGNNIRSSSNSIATANRTPSQPPLPAWKKQAERNVLIQEHTTHANELEAKRKDFRRQTQLKTWPLQDMAMEHLDHLLGMNASNQFHGGDYLSSESSSSISSAESSRPRLSLSTKKRTTKSSLPDITASPTKSSQTNDKVNRHSNGKNEVEQQQQQDKNDIDIDKIDNIIKDEFDGISTTEQQQQQQQQQSPLWSLEPRIFATEKKNGKRKYLVGEFGRIADWYWRKTEPSSRHLYELIREDTPCRLYFDLEFSREYNPSVPAKALLRELEDELAIELQTYYGKSMTSLQSSQIINLDSSNDKKFSRHWIVHLYQVVEDEDKESPPSSSSATSVHKQRRELLFRDAPTVGRFIKRMVGRLANELAVTGGDFAERRPALFKYLFVNTKDTAKQTCFIDLGVYTRNRIFRCLGSSKFGKTSILQVVLHEKLEEQDQVEKEENDDKYNNDNTDIPSTGNDDGTERHYYPLNFPSKKELSSSQSSSPLSINDFVLANNWEPHARALADSLVVPLTSSSTKPRDMDSVHILEVEGGSDGCGSTGAVADNTKTTTSAGNTGSQRKFAPSISMARQGSPLPSLDQFVVECLGTRGPMGIRGSIRAWSIEYGPRETPVSFTYQMQRNRFCELVGRSHKSNNIFWTIDLISWTCIQGCHDPDCFGRGSPISISNNGKLSGRGGHLDSIKQEFESWQEEEFEKALMALNLDDIIATSKEISSSAASKNDSRKKNEEDEEESGDMGTFSDEVLLQACLDNPELFP